MENKERYISLLRKTNREGIEDLISWLETTDFYVAPASSKYHGSYEGGLCEHSLHVYDKLVQLVDVMKADFKEDELIIAALLHDLSKTDFYEKTYRNKKLYSSTGSKYDDGGRYDWVSVESFQVRDPDDRFIYGAHEETSVYLAQQYIKLSTQESSAIAHHHAGMGWDSIPYDKLNDVFKHNQLIVYLHLADMFCANVENI